MPGIDALSSCSPHDKYVVFLKNLLLTGLSIFSGIYNEYRNLEHNDSLVHPFIADEDVGLCFKMLALTLIHMPSLVPISTLVTKLMSLNDAPRLLIQVRVLLGYCRGWKDYCNYRAVIL